MKVAIGSTILATGTPSGEPARLVQATGAKQVQAIHRIRAAKGRFADRANRSYADVVEVSYSYSTAALAQQGILTRRVAALEATGNLIYGDGAGDTTVGPATVEQVELLEWTGCGFTLRYTIHAVET